MVALAGPVWAQTHRITWALTGFTAGGTAFPWLELDVVELGRYISAHGAILTEARQLSPATGTCARVAAGGFFCNLQIDRNSYFMSLDAQLNGTITGRDGSGNVLPESVVTLHSRQ
jgi:hypothetical protein